MSEYPDFDRRAADSARARVADFWDEVLADWLSGREHLSARLARWRASYQGTGKGAVDLEHYPDPYVGDLRGVECEPRMVLLGLNPGVGYDSLQSMNGLWAQRIARFGYSYCFRRSPEEDPKAWRELHGKRSRYWLHRVLFAQRWLNDQRASVRDILNFELYPWHSYKVNAPLLPPPDLIEKFVWGPVRELAVPEVFAFGAPWFQACQGLGLHPLALLGPPGQPITTEAPHWRLGFFELSHRQVLVVSSQPGYAGPPGSERLKQMRVLLDETRKQESFRNRLIWTPDQVTVTPPSDSSTKARTWR